MLDCITVSTYCQAVIEREYRSCGLNHVLFREPIGATAEEFEEAKVAQDLELLADFIADVGVLG
jgi:hypothetical protein